MGLFKNRGATWSRQPQDVNDHDFRSSAKGLAVPYGIYDLHANRGTVFVGDSRDTPAFAVDCIEHWFRTEGSQRYTAARRLVILADCGGSNSYRAYAWKYFLQTVLCDAHRLRVTVAHYPGGASKWNAPSAVMRPCLRFPPAEQQLRQIQGRITLLAHRDRRNPIRRSSCFHDGAGSSSDDAQQAIA